MFRLPFRFGKRRPASAEGEPRASAAAAGMPDEAEVREALRRVIDPEVGMNMVDLGLIYGIELSPGRVHVRMTMTTPACPMGASIAEEARQAIQALAPQAIVEVQLVWEPAWSPTMMSEHAKRHFGWSKT